MINRDRGKRSGVWELPRTFGTNEIGLTLVDFFDWTAMEYIDLRYYEVLIDWCPSDPEVVGHYALVENILVEIFWTPESAEPTADSGPTP